MKLAASQAIETESAFLAGVKANFQQGAKRLLPGAWFKAEEHDSGDQVYAAMVDRRIYDRERRAAMPQGRRVTVKGFDRRWIFGKKLRSVTVASVLSPPEPFLEGQEPPPVTASQLLTHVRSLVTDSKTPHLIAVCSPSGFEPGAIQASLDLTNVSLVLIERRKGGGWSVSSNARKLDGRVLKMFDPEVEGEKRGRVRREIEDRRIDLLTGGISAGSMAGRLGLPVKSVQEVFESVARSDPELRLSKRSGEWMLFRGTSAEPGEETSSMSVAQWIRSLFSSEGKEAEKINVLRERRAALDDKLKRMYEDIGKLEQRETQLREEGKAAAAMVIKRRIAAQIAHLHKDISRHNTSAAMLGKQINIISTHIHNLELARTGSVAQLPTGEELTEAAVNAEEILEQLTASDDLVSGLDVSMAQAAVSDDEAAILKELQGPEPASPAASQDREAVPPKVADGQSQRAKRGEAQAE